MGFIDEYGISTKNVEYEEVFEIKKNIFEKMSISFTKKFKPTIEEIFKKTQKILDNRCCK